MREPYETALENDIEQRVRDLAGTPEQPEDVENNSPVVIAFIAFALCCTASGFGFGLLVHFLGWLP